jgi:hypothetical protein
VLFPCDEGFRPPHVPKRGFAFVERRQIPSLFQTTGTNVADEGLKVAHGARSLLRRLSRFGFLAESRAVALQVIP